METKIDTEAELISTIINQAIKRAKDNGYTPVSLEPLLFSRARTAGKSHSMQIWAKGLLFDKDFARALFGSHEVDSNGWNINAIKFWAKQVAVEIEGKIRAIPEAWDRPNIAYAVMPEVDINEMARKAPLELAEATKVVMDIQHMAASIPFKTHSIKEVDIYGTQPAYEYHLKEMAVSDNPFIYVRDFLND